MSQVATPIRFDPGNDKFVGRADVTVGKNRNGPTGECLLEFSESSCTFFDPAAKVAEEEESDPVFGEASGSGNRPVKGAAGG